jgi:hypothetical protein
VTARDTATGGSSLRWNTSNGQGFIREGRRGDIYAGRDGNVYRNTGDGWQRFDGGWQDVGRPGPGELLQRGEGREGLSPDARERLQERGGGEALRGLAGAGAAGAAGAALGQRLDSGGPRTRDRVEGGAGRERVEQRPSAGERPSASARPAGQERAQQRPVQQRPAAKERQATQQRPAAKPRPAPQQRPTAQRPAARPAVSQQLPSNLTRDVQARNLGNQRHIASRQFSGPAASPQFSRRPASYSPQRSFGASGSFGRGGASRGGGFGGRGGGRR